MSATPARQVTLNVPPALRPLAATALLLEKLERTPREASPAQYRSVTQRVAALLQAAEPGPALDQLLAAFPATAEVYENLHYATSGLCRSALEPSLNAELDAAALLRRLRAAGPG